MKKVFGLFLSIIVLMGLSACEVELPDEPQKPNPEPIPEETGCLTFVSSGESLVALAKVGEPFDISLEYSLDGKSWNPYTIRKAIYLLDGGELSFRAGETGNERFSKGSWDNYRFIISGSVSAKGNIMSLLDRSCRKNAVPANAFFYLFCDCTGLTEAPKLPATELAEGCYTRMFEGCANISKAPALPAVKLAERCYEGMFSHCTNLIEVPALPATELAERCYEKMFFCCKSLTKAPELPATELVEGCYYYMFEGCTSLTKAPELPATELAERCYYSMFAGCTNLTKAPELPATELSKLCYHSMFGSCTSLTEVPTLPATKLALECYSNMFNGCTRLTKAPALPATELSELCYYEMFWGCTSLTEAPELPATELAHACYYYMFMNCTGLTEAPTLPAKRLAENCYEDMFCGCTSLTEAPELPATVMKSGCYRSMFAGCTSLTKAPELPATELAEYCYGSMFAGCTSLNYVKALFTDEPSKETTTSWLSSVSSTGTFVKNKYATWDVRGDDGIPEGWTIESDAGTSDDSQKPNPDESLCLTFVSSGESTITLIKIGDPSLITLEYSTNGSIWNPYTIGDSISLLDGEKLMFRAGKDGNDYFSLNSSHYYNFKISGSVAAKGNIMSLLDRSCHKKIVPSHAFNSLFKYCEALTSAPTLSATKLGNNCYYCMFRGCTSLTEAPALPAKVMAKVCYSGMFWGCTSLMKAPELPATVMKSGCYRSMFAGCTSLTKAPELPATELAEYCYGSMFAGCTSLNYVKALFTDEPSKETTREWLLGVSPTGTFVKSKDATWEVRGENGIPEGWTIITE